MLVLFVVVCDVLYSIVLYCFNVLMCVTLFGRVCLGDGIIFGISIWMGEGVRGKKEPFLYNFPFYHPNVILPSPRKILKM